jgi:hypothetical protein
VTHFGQNSAFELLARAQHEEDIRRAAEHRLVREANAQGKSLGLIWRIFSRLALSDEAAAESGTQPNPQSAA